MSYKNKNTGELHIVDFKSTWSIEQALSGQPRWGMEGRPYKRQMDMYIWLMRRKGFETSDTGYFVYVDGLHDGINGMLEGEKITIDLPQDYAPSGALYDQTGVMFFGLAVLEYNADTSWVSETLVEILPKGKKLPRTYPRMRASTFLSTIKRGHSW